MSTENLQIMWKWNKEQLSATGLWFMRSACCGLFLIGIAMTIWTVGKELAVWYGLRIVYTSSLPRGLYVDTNELLHRGTLVEECLPEELARLGRQRRWIGQGFCASGASPILKRVVGLPGDIIELTDDFVAVNGARIPNSATQKVDTKGRLVPIIPRGKLVLRPGEVFLLATNRKDSWDGRQTGPAQISDLIATARPVLTEGRNE